MVRLFDLSQSEPEGMDNYMDGRWGYDQKPGMARWTAIWLSAVLLLCFIASCQHWPALTRGIIQ